MIEIVNRLSDKEALVRADKEYGLFSGSQIVCCDFGLFYGDITDACRQSERRILDRVIDVKKSVCELVGLLEQDKNVRIWTSRSNVESYLMFLFVLDVLDGTDANISVIFVDDIRVPCGDDGYFIFDSLSVTVPDNIKDYLLGIERGLSDKERGGYISEWHSLQKKNSPMRIMQNKKCVNVDIDHFDKLILTEFKAMQKMRRVGEFSHSGKPYDGTVLMASIVGEMIGGHCDKTSIFELDYFCSRITALVEAGKLVEVEKADEGRLNAKLVMAETFDDKKEQN